MEKMVFSDEKNNLGCSWGVGDLTHRSECSVPLLAAGERVLMIMRVFFVIVNLFAHIPLFFIILRIFGGGSLFLRIGRTWGAWVA